MSRPYNFVVDKAYRRKQGEGIVTYVEPLSRNNAVYGKSGRSQI